MKLLSIKLMRRNQSIMSLISACSYYVSHLCVFLFVSHLCEFVTFAICYIESLCVCYLSDFRVFVMFAICL